MAGSTCRDGECGWVPTPRGILVFGRGIETLVGWESPGIARVYCLPSGAGLGAHSHAELPDSLMLDPERKMDRLSLAIREHDGFLEVRTGFLELRVELGSGAFSWHDAEGRLLVRENPRGGRSLEAAIQPRRVSRNVFRTRLDLVFSEGEALFGLGQHEEGRLDYRGRHQYLYQQNRKVALPFLHSSRGYGILYDSTAPVVFRDDDLGSFLLGEADEALDFFVISGHAGYGSGADSGDCGFRSISGSDLYFAGSADRVIAGMRRLTGRAALPPEWAFGYFQSKERYRTQEEILEVARDFRKRGLPLDCIVLDWLSWPSGLWGQKSFDPLRFPDPTAMIRELHEMGLRFMISIWPHLQGDGPDRRELIAAGYLLGNDSTCDSFSPGARAMYWEQANRGLFAHGLDAWWCDCTEPFEADWKGSVMPLPEERRGMNTGMAAEYLDPSQCQAFSLVHSRGIWEGQRKVGMAGGEASGTGLGVGSGAGVAMSASAGMNKKEGGKRVLNLTRSASLGQQRYGTFTWSGDLSASWEVLRGQIPEGLNFCLSGMPYWTNDIGGFFVASKDEWFWKGEFPAGVDDPGYRELYLRWFQYATFLPMMRAHGTDTPREPWRFGEAGDGEKIYDTLARFLRLRQRLRPYLYSLAGAVTFGDYTMIRALYFDFPEDREALGIEDQFMLGPALMVCPVTEPQRYAPGRIPLRGVRETRSVYLPGSESWIDFWTGEAYGPGWIEAPATISIIPVFLRRGSLLPLASSSRLRRGSIDRDSGLSEFEGTAAETGTPALEILIVPGCDGHFYLYGDAGDGYGYERGDYTFTELVWRDSIARLEVSDRHGGRAELLPAGGKLFVGPSPPFIDHPLFGRLVPRIVRRGFSPDE